MTDTDPDAFPFPTADRHDKVEPTKPVEQDPSEDAIDQGVEESFPASDPVAVSVTKVERVSDVDEKGKAGGRDGTS